MINPQPLFTIATITYNSGLWVKQAIESVLASGYEDFEYLISDDHSTDDTWEQIQIYNDTRIRAWRNEKNIGEYPNRNKILNEAKGRYILYIDGDDLLYKSTLRNIAEYIEAFPEAGMIWGVSTSANLYEVLPFLFEPAITLKLLYSNLYHLSVIGFAETVFSVDALKRINNGFPEDYHLGDSFIRKKIALTEKVLFIPLGLSFWRSSQNQASARLGIGLKGMTEGYEIDLRILNDSSYPLGAEERYKVLKNLKTSLIKRLVFQTIFRFRFYLFYKIFQRLKLSVNDLFLVFRKIDNEYLPVKDISSPLMNDYNFIRKGEQMSSETTHNF